VAVEVLYGHGAVIWVQFYQSAHHDPAGFSAMKPVTAHPLLDDEHADFSSVPGSGHGTGRIVAAEMNPAFGPGRRGRSKT
jgi:hypothetical protein